MRDPSELRLNGRCSTLFSWLILAFLCVAVIAQKNAKSNPPKYDLHTETKIKATVEEVKLPPKGSEKEAAHLLVKTGTDTLDVYLCPKSFLVDMGVSFGKGDEIALTGSKIKQGEADLVPDVTPSICRRFLRPSTPPTLHPRVGRRPMEN